MRRRDGEHPQEVAMDRELSAYRLLGIPAKTTIFRVTIHHLERHDHRLSGYVWLWVGCMTSSPIRWPDGIATAFAIPGQPPQFRLQVYQWCVYRPDSPLYGELRWHPGCGIVQHVGGLTVAHTKRDLDKVWRALEVTKQLTARPGRPIGSGYRHDDDALEAMILDYIHTRLQQGHTPSAGEVATWLDERDPLCPDRAHRSTMEYLRRFCRRRGYPRWAAVIARARA